MWQSFCSSRSLSPYRPRSKPRQCSDLHGYRGHSGTNDTPSLSPASPVGRCCSLCRHDDRLGTRTDHAHSFLWPRPLPVWRRLFVRSQSRGLWRGLKWDGSGLSPTLLCSLLLCCSAVSPQELLWCRQSSPVFRALPSAALPCCYCHRFLVVWHPSLSSPDSRQSHMTRLYGSWIYCDLSGWKLWCACEWVSVCACKVVCVILGVRALKHFFQFTCDENTRKKEGKIKMSSSWDLNVHTILSFHTSISFCCGCGSHMIRAPHSASTRAHGWPHRANAQRNLVIHVLTPAGPVSRDLVVMIKGASLLVPISVQCWAGVWR